MKRYNSTKQYFGILVISLLLVACKTPTLVNKDVSDNMPSSFTDISDSTNSAEINWRTYFSDTNLIALIDTALNNNQELNMVLQEIQREKNDISAKRGEFLPSVGLGAGAGLDKAGRYTSKGSSEATTDIEPGRATPDPLPDFVVGAYASWEVDIWHKLRNAKDAQVMRYLSSLQGRNFMVTNLISEIASSYYELMALDNQLAIIQQNIKIQSDALEIVKIQKQSARVTELAVRRFEAQVLKTRSMQFDITQKIVETENRINYLVGRYPQHVIRNYQNFEKLILDTIYAGLPSQMLENRPDIQQAELALAATRLDVKSAKANFYPSLRLSAGVGLNAFNPTYLVSRPESIIFNLLGDLSAPLINRKAIKTMYKNANAKQIEAIYNYEKTVLKAYIEVVNQLSSINNLEKSFALREERVNTLTASIKISSDLFKSARADYMEVLLTQRDALESKFELIETKRSQLNAYVNIYRSLGGGWQ